MTKMVSYTYVVLRYRHDPLTEEFLNVGVILLTEEGATAALFTHKIGRAKSLFPSMDKHAFRGALSSVIKSYRRMAREAGPDILRATADARSLAHDIFVPGDTALQWSAMGAGLTTNFDATVESLFDRFVSKYEISASTKKTDLDVWKSLKNQLEIRNIADRLMEKTIRGEDDEIEFKHAVKNGEWHCILPLSFDLADADGMRDKARRWAGNLLSVSDAKEKFKTYIVMARPADGNLKHEYEMVKSILKKSPIETEIFDEGEAGNLAERIAHVIRSHDNEDGNLLH